MTDPTRRSVAAHHVYTDEWLVRTPQERVRRTLAQQTGSAVEELVYLYGNEIDLSQIGITVDKEPDRRQATLGIVIVASAPLSTGPGIFDRQPAVIAHHPGESKPVQRWPLHGVEAMAREGLTAMKELNS